MTANPFAALLDGVPRYDVSPVFAEKENHDGIWMREADVLAALAAAVPADLAEAGKVLEPLRKLADDMDRHATDEWDESELICKTGDLIRALLARLAAQEAQIKGLEAEKRYWQGEIDTVLAGRADEHDRAEAAETALAAERAKVAKLVEALKPFAEYIADGGDNDDKGEPLPDTQGVGWVYLTVGDFRRARAAITEAGQ